ncbi:hypothetical protein SAMN05216563_12910 [Phytobacter palmae]|nr:hypothetical protein SAMN05216563_12910 [Phytobacter palmae]
MGTLVHWKTLLFRAFLSALVVTLFWYKSEGVKVEALVNASGVITGLAGTLLGFLITSMSLITALMDKKLVINMIKTGHYKCLISDTILTCTFLLALIVSCVVCLISQASMIIYTFHVIIFFLCISILYLIEAGKRFSIVVLNIK